MIYLKEYLNKEHVLFFHSREDKSSVLEKMISHISKAPEIIDPEAFRTAVFHRESLMSTGIGLGIAIPHVKIPQVKNITICIGIAKEGIEWDSLDGDPVNLIFLMAGAEDQHDIYLRLLSKIVLVLRKKDRREKLINAESPDQVISYFSGL